MKWIVVLVIAAVVVGIVGLGAFMWYKSNYDKAVSLDEATDAKLKQIDVYLQRRYDLIPNLVDTVKGYAKHETALFTSIAEARKSYFSAQNVGEKVAASGTLESALSRLLMLQENYPDLKANQSFQKLQDELAGTENRIGFARADYNEAVKALNTYIRTYFGRYFAEKAGVGPAEYFEIPEDKADEIRTVPDVEF